MTIGEGKGNTRGSGERISSSGTWDLGVTKGLHTSEGQPMPGNVIFYRAQLGLSNIKTLAGLQGAG